MKILFLTRLYNPYIGGVEKHVAEIAKRLANKGYEITIITETDNLELQLVEVKDKIKIYRIQVGNNEKRKKFKIWRELWKLRNIISNADIVHCHDVFYWYFPFRFMYPSKAVFTTFHGYETYPIKKTAIIVRKISEKLSFGNICIGDFMKKWYGTKPTYISYGGVDISIKNTSSTINKHSAVFIGRLDDQTGIMTYVKSISLVRKKISSFAFLIIGDGKYKKSASRIGKAIGAKTNPIDYLQNYHFAFVSRYLSILEALAAKKLIFAEYDNPVKEDYLRMASFAKYIIIVKNEFELADKITYFLNHENEEKLLVDNGYRWAKQQTWDNVVDIYINLWSKNSN